MFGAACAKMPVRFPVVAVSHNSVMMLDQKLTEICRLVGFNWVVVRLVEVVEDNIGMRDDGVRLPRVSPFPL